MANIQRRQLQLRAHQLAYREASQALLVLERNFRAAEKKFKISKKKIMLKIVIALIQQNAFRQRILFRRLDQLNRVSLFYKSLKPFTCNINNYRFTH